MMTATDLSMIVIRVLVVGGLFACACAQFDGYRNQYYGNNFRGNFGRDFRGNFGRNFGQNFRRNFGFPPQNPRCTRPLRRSDCRLFDFKSDLVTREAFLNMLTGNEWFPAYVIEDGSPSRFGKCRVKFSSTGGDRLLREEQCFNLDSKMCDNFTIPLTISEDDCGRVMLRSDDGMIEDTMYSQDLDKYYWRDLCEGKNGNGDCTQGRFIDLQVKASRLDNDDRVPDYTSVPWDLVAADLKNIFNREFNDSEGPEVRYVELGTECRL